MGWIDALPGGPAGLAFPLIIFSALIHAVYNALIKAARDKLVARMLMALTSSVLIMPVAFFVPLPSPGLLSLLGGTAIVHFTYQMAQIKSLQHADYTLAYPVSRGTAPLIVAGFAPLVLGDVVSPWQLAGIAVISLAILSMAFSAPKGNGTGLMFAAITGMAIAAYTLIDAKGSRMAPHPLTFIVWFFIFDSIVISTFTLTQHRQRFIAAFRHEWKLAILNGMLGICTFGAALLAFRFGNAPVMAALRETSVLFAMLIGFVFLAERFGPKRILAILGIAAGVAIIRFV
jgi:drug/metabolite transporter (DMT)-like permease